MTTPICRSCKHIRRTNMIGVESHAYGQVKKHGTLYCDGFYMEIIEEATECSKFEILDSTGLKDMREMAFILEKRTKIGFDKPVFEFKKPESGKP